MCWCDQKQGGGQPKCTCKQKIENSERHLQAKKLERQEKVANENLVVAENSVKRKSIKLKMRFSFQVGALNFINIEYI